MLHVGIRVYLIVFFFFGIFLVQSASADEIKKRVLVLHSYHQGYHWTDKIMAGMLSVFDKRDDVELFVSYMDTKRRSDSVYFKQLRDLYAKKYEFVTFDAIISSDDHALNFLLEFRDELFPDTPVIFSGLNTFSEKRLRGKSKFTGIFESYDIPGTIDLMLSLHPKTTSITTISDDTLSGHIFKQLVVDVESNFNNNVKFNYLDNLSPKDLQQSLSKLPENSLVLWAIYLRTPSGATLSSEESVKLVSQSSRFPTYCVWDVVGQGVVGGKITSPNYQGETAAKTVVRILQGARIEDIPVIGSPLVNIFDYKIMKKFNISADKIPEPNIFLNKPISFYAKHKQIILVSAFLIFILLIVVIIQLTANQSIKQKVKETLANFNILFMETPIPLCHVSSAGDFTMLNKEFTKVLGYNLDDLHTIDDWWILAYPDAEYREFVLYTWSKLVEKATLKGEDIEAFSYNVTCKNGNVKIMEISGTIIGSGLIATLINMTDRVEAENELKANNEKLIGLYEMSPLGIALTDMNGVYVEFNDAFASICGYTEEELKALDYWELTPKKYMNNEGKQLEMLKKTGFYGPYEKEYIKKDGSLIPINLNGMIVTNSKGEKLIWSIVEDISDRKENQKMLEHIAHYDSLTGLPNRVLFADRLQQAMNHAHRIKRKVIVAYLDLDGFKEVNDTYGHDTGDKLLIEVSKRMKLILREDDSIARLGGDEFVILLNDFEDVISSIEVVDRLLQSISEPIIVGDFSLHVSVSIGLTYYPQSEEVDADQLLRQSDQAMYQAKLTGKNKYYILNPDKDMNIREKNDKLEKINFAIENNEFVMYYQPKVNLRTGCVIGMEALVRWQHPEEGVLSPALFLPDIEGNTLYIKFDEMIINKVLTQMNNWKQDGINIPVSINISAISIQEKDFVQRIQEIISKHQDIVLSNIEFEILETSSLSDMTHVSEVLSALNEIGIKSSLDDFGTGYSSLTYLRRLPVHSLKIDQSFVIDMLDDPEDFAIVDGVIGLASAFNKDVIAEGMENIEHGNMLLRLGCELAQGYAIAKPMPAIDFPHWLKNWKTEPSWNNIVPVEHNKLQILYSQIEHKAWIKNIDNIINGKIVKSIEINENECRFGKWLNSMNPDGNRKTIDNIKVLHSDIHTLANELIVLNNKGKNDIALSSLPKLHELRDKLLNEVGFLL